MSSVAANCMHCNSFAWSFSVSCCAYVHSPCVDAPCSGYQLTKAAIFKRTEAEKEAFLQSRRCLICEDREVNCVLIPCGM